MVKNENIQKHDPIASNSILERNQTVDFLKAEHTRLAEEIESIYSQMNQTMAIAASALGVVIGVVTSSKLANPVLLWAAPAVILIIYGFVLVLSSRWSAHFFQIRIICDKLVELTGESPIVLYNHEESVVSRFHSLKSGNPKYRAMVNMLFVMLVVFFLYLLVYSFQIIYSTNHLSGFLFIVVYIIITSIYIMGFSSILYDLPDLFSKVMDQVKSDPTKLPKIRSLVKSGINPAQILIPRPFDFITKTWLFVIGMTAMLWENGPVFNPKIWKLFITQSTTSPPLWTAIAFAFCWYGIQEGIVQQAKYIWNDIRDRRVDQYFDVKRRRAIASGVISLRGAIVQLFVRWLGGLLLGALLDYRLFWLLLTISIVHILYELWAKPNGATRPVPALILVALGSPLRVLGGALSVSDGYLNLRGILLITTFFFFGIGCIANFWKIEAEHRKTQKSSISPRPQSEYFHKKGLLWQHFGFSGTFVCAMILSIDSLLCFRYHLCLNSALGLLFKQFHLNIPSGLEAGIGILIVAMGTFVITWLIWKPLTKVLGCFSNRSLIIKVIVLIATIFPFMYYARFNRNTIYISIILALSVVAFTSYEHMDYNQYMFVYLRKNWRVIKNLWFIYLFDANSGISFLRLLRMTVALSQNDVEVVKGKLPQSSIHLSQIKDAIVQAECEPTSHSTQPRYPS